MKMLLVVLSGAFFIASPAPVTQTTTAKRTTTDTLSQEMTSKTSATADDTTMISISIQDTTQISVTFTDYSVSTVTDSTTAPSSVAVTSGMWTEDFSEEQSTQTSNVVTVEETTETWSGGITNSTLSSSATSPSNVSVTIGAEQNLTEREIAQRKIRAYFDAVLEEEINNIANDTRNERITFRFRDFLREVAKENTSLPPLILHLKHSVVKNKEVTDVDEYINESLKDFIESLELKDLLDRNINARTEEVEDEMPNYINLLFGGFGK